MSRADTPHDVRSATPPRRDDQRAATVDAERATLSHRLVDRLRDAGIVSTREVEQALLRVPRDAFLPGATLHQAWANQPVYTKHDGGVRISAASQPGVVAMMLEQLHVRPGDRILEIGAGTGYNAALLAALAGPTGHVTAIDIDDDLVTTARDHIAAAAVPESAPIELVRADGALGCPDRAPFDRVVATVGAHDIPPAWLAQLAPTGRALAPIRLAGAASRSIIFERGSAGWTSRGSDMNVFMPLRGAFDDARRVLDLTATGEVTLQLHADNAHATPATLVGVLTTPAHTHWTGVEFASGESWELLDLWLACHLHNPIMRMEVAPAARERGLVTPAFPTAAMATSDQHANLAYLTIRAVLAGPDGASSRRRFEVGVIAHGPDPDPLAEELRRAITTWDRDARHLDPSFILPDHPAPHHGSAGQILLDRAHTPIIIAWQ